MKNASALRPRRHDPPAGWPADVFGKLTDALAVALGAAARRALEAEIRERDGGEAEEEGR